MKKTKHIYLLISGILLAIGFLGFAISPLIFGNRISNYNNEISEFEHYRQLASNNLTDASDWYKVAGITSNFATVASVLNADNAIIKRLKTDYINESKFALNSLFISMKSAKGEFDINEDELWNKWTNISEPKDFFEYQKEYSSLAMSEFDKLEERITDKKNQINKIENTRRWIWTICIIFQTLGMFIGTYHSYIKDVNEN